MGRRGFYSMVSDWAMRRRLVTDEQLSNKMSLAALMEAQKRSWHDAMECLVRGYCEVIEAAKMPVAV